MIEIGGYNREAYATKNADKRWYYHIPQSKKGVFFYYNFSEKVYFFITIQTNFYT